MEPSGKKRKLAPKVNPSPVPSSQSTHYNNEASHAATPAPQQQWQSHAATHDASQRHDFESFARHLQDAAMLIQRQAQHLPYSDVSVLLLNWEQDRSVDDDVDALDQVLHKEYRFKTQRWQIPSVPNPSIKLGVQMASFLENARPSHLLIIYYAGHGYLGPDGQLYWACNMREDAAKVKWDGFRCLFEDAQSDILLLLDTCAIPDPTPAGSHGVKQAIAAYSADHGPRDTSRPSFTSQLVDAFQKLSQDEYFTVYQLYQELTSQTHKQAHQQTRHHQTSNGVSPSPPLKQHPIFFMLTPPKRQYLTIAPLPSIPPSASSQDAADSVGGHVRHLEQHGMDRQLVASVRFDEARVLVCTTFVGDASPDMSSFNQWLQNAPEIGSKLTVEGMFLGPPTMLLISMPQSVWNIVQHDKVCCYLGYISSHNMTPLYQRLVGSAGLGPSAKEVEDGRILLEAREMAAGTPSHATRERDGNEKPYPAPSPVERSIPLGDGQGSVQHSSPSGAGFTSIASPKPNKEVEDSAEMQEAAEQLKALSHMRHQSVEGHAAGPRSRTSLPDAVPQPCRDHGNGKHSQTRGDDDEHNVASNFGSSTGPRLKASRRFLPKQETRCSHCSHAPFKDSSSLRKHIAAAHTRPFPCAFSFAGCTSTFGSKNEWKRHIASQHLCLQYYRCSQCPQSTVEGKGNEFNRKDLFTQHLRRMHADFQIKRAMSKGDTKLLAEWEEHVKKMQQTCLVTRRQPPQRSACPKTDCQHEFKGAGAWDEWTEHVGRHLEKGEAQCLSIDTLLAQWALEEKIIERKADGGYRLCVTNGMGSQGSNGSMVAEAICSTSGLAAVGDGSQGAESSNSGDVGMIDGTAATNEDTREQSSS
ncbi:hypothetical protein CDD82_6370 [Ophiocordyceps australis]|uniref:C2H2-type domain-containing protein n=1 Tax=Ophiocordyceps australis TaxID=1399860 RepID=A0A2C5YXB7_9HYPO|nr:hypothetical protein CDD82_6370 [Ophiocordyceps australis]